MGMPRKADLSRKKTANTLNTRNEGRTFVNAAEDFCSTVPRHGDPPGGTRRLYGTRDVCRYRVKDA